MSNEMLTDRLEQLQRSLSEVEAVVEMLEASRKAVKDTKQSVSAARLKATQLTGVSDLQPLTDAVQELRLHQSDDDLATADQVLDLLERLGTKLPELIETLSQASRDLDRLVHRYVPFGDLKQHI